MLIYCIMFLRCIKVTSYKKSTYANRGMFLEHIINDSNTYYLQKDIAVIYKKPTPIKVLNVCFRSKQTTIIDKAVFSETSTLDYNGIYKGKYIEFDAKNKFFVHQCLLGPLQPLT